MNKISVSVFLLAASLLSYVVLKRIAENQKTPLLASPTPTVQIASPSASPNIITITPSPTATISSTPTPKKKSFLFF